MKQSKHTLTTTNGILDLQKNPIWDAGKDEAFNSRYDIHVLPEQEIPDSEKTPEWYMRNARYVASWYNQPYLPPMYTWGSYMPDASPEMRTSDPSMTLYPINEMLINNEYLHGRQPNSRYNYMVSNVTTSNLQPMWQPGRKIAQILDSFEGSVRTLTSNIMFSVRSMSPDAVSDVSDYLDNIMIKLNYAEHFQKMKEIGIEYNPANGQDFETPEQAKVFIDNGGYKDTLGDIATNIANGIWTENRWNQKSMQALEYFKSAGICAIEHYVEGGRLYQDVVVPWQLIYDLRRDDDFNADARFVGVIRFLTPGEIFNRWKGFDDDQKKEIERLANWQTGTLSNLNSMPGFSFNWWMQGGRTPTSNFVACVSVYWMGRKDLGIEKYQTRFGQEKIRNAENSDSWVDAVHKCTLIGNRWMVDMGYQSNQVEDFSDKNRLRFPISVFVPKTMYGQIISPVAKVKRLQDDRDMAKFKIKEMIGNAKGKNHVIYAQNKTALDIVQDFASLGLTVVNLSTGEPDDEMHYTNKLVETVDWTLDPNIDKIWQFHDLIGTEMEEILSTSKLALGQQQTYLGYESQQSSLSQSSLGMSCYIDGFMNFLQRNMQYALNMYKSMASTSPNTQMKLLIGNKGVEYFNVTKELAFEDQLVFLNINDVIQQPEKQVLVQTAQMAVQAGTLDMYDMVEIDAAKTYSQLRKYLAKAIGEKKADVQKQQAIQQMQAAAMQAQNGQIQQGIAAIQSHVALAKQSLADENKGKHEILKGGIQDHLAANDSARQQMQPQEAAA